MNIEFSGWPRASRGRMITLEGADGAGKSTLAVRVADNLALRRNVRFQRRKDYLPDHPIVSKAMRGVSVLLWDRGDCHGDNELPPAYWLHLQAAWHAASYHSYIEPALSQGQTILLDGWYYKFYAKMLLGKYTPDELNLFFSDAGQPDIVILLDRDLNEVWENARRFNHSELGLHEGYEQLGKDSFLSYQLRIREQYYAIAQKHSWVIYKPNPNAHVDEDAARLTGLVEQALAHDLIEHA